MSFDFSIKQRDVGVCPRRVSPALPLVRQFWWLGRCKASKDGLMVASAPGSTARRTDNSKHHQHQPRPDRANPQTPPHALTNLPPSDIESSNTDSPIHHHHRHDIHHPRLSFPRCCPSCDPDQHQQSILPTTPCTPLSSDTSLHIHSRQHPTRLHSLSSSAGSRNDGKLCSRPALSPTSH